MNNIFTKKIISALLALMLIASAVLFSGCTGNVTELDTPDDSTKTDTPSDETQTEPIELPVPVPTEADTRIVMNVGGYDVSFAELRYYLSNVKTQVGGTNKELWLDQVKDILTENAALKQLVGERNVTVSKEAQDAMDKSLAEFFATYEQTADASYEDDLKAINLTDVLFRSISDFQLLTQYFYQTEYYEKAAELVSEQDVLDYINENYVRVKHILIKTVDLDDAQKAEARTRADSILSDAKNGASFEALVSEYSEDGMDVDKGYYFTRGQMVPEFEAASYELEVGEISELVESTYGYHIIKKYEMDKEHILADESIYNNAAAALVYNIFEKDLVEKKNGIQVTYGDTYQAAVDEILAETAE